MAEYLKLHHCRRRYVLTVEEAALHNRRDFLREAGAMTLMLTIAGENAQGKKAVSPARLRVTGEWQVTVAPGKIDIGRRTVKIAREATLAIAPATLLQIRDEKY